METIAAPIPDLTMLTRQEAADALKVGVRLIDRFLKQGGLRATRFGSRVLIRREDLIAFAEQLRTEQEAEVLPNRTQRNRIADIVIEAARRLNDGNAEAWASEINRSDWSPKFFLYEAISMLAFADAKSDGTLLDALQKIAGTQR